MISKISMAIGSEKLIEIIDQIAQENAYPSYELISLLTQIEHNPINVELVKTLKLKYKKDKNWWALQTLSYYLQLYMNTHRIDFRTKQQLCDLLGLKNIPNITSRFIEAGELSR
jgi:hypothetical protein